ncbi:65-kDa microtubule-associated protein 8, partial [Mucuna pruriens]
GTIKSNGFIPDTNWNEKFHIARDFMWIPVTGTAGKRLIFFILYDEVGEDKFEREKVLLDLEQECLEVYRRKVDRANISRARLHQELVEAEAEFTHLLLSLGERSLPGWPEKRAGSLKEQLDSITPALREMRLRKEERLNQFRNVQGNSDNEPSTVVVNENDLSLKRLEEYQNELQRLYNEKNERLQQVEKYIDIIHSLSTILGKDSSAIIMEVHPSLNDLCGITKNISDTILDKLNITVESLFEEKQNRLDKLHHLGKALSNLWNLMDTPYSERLSFSHVINLLSLSSAEVTDPGSLTLEIVQQTEAEVKRLDQLKASKMKELFQKKQEELELICKKSHVEIPSREEMNNIINLINSGEIDHSDLLLSMDEQISRAKEEAYSRKAIMEKVEKWMLARDEERWLEEYSMDENRYSVSRGAHKNLRRAERARIMVSRMPALVDLLIKMTRSWEEERNKVFLYDQVPLLAILEEYNILRREKEEDTRRQQPWEKKRIQSHVVERDNSYASRPGTSSRRLPNRSLNGALDTSVALSKRLSMGIQSNSINSGNHGLSFIKDGRNALRKKIFGEPGFASHTRDEASSVMYYHKPNLTNLNDNIIFANFKCANQIKIQISIAVYKQTNKHHLRLIHGFWRLGLGWAFRFWLSEEVVDAASIGRRIIEFGPRRSCSGLVGLRRRRKIIEEKILSGLVPLHGHSNMFEIHARNWRNNSVERDTRNNASELTLCTSWSSIIIFFTRLLGNSDTIDTPFSSSSAIT